MKNKQELIFKHHYFSSLNKHNTQNLFTTSCHDNVPGRHSLSIHLRISEEANTNQCFFTFKINYKFSKNVKALVIYTKKTHINISFLYLMIQFYMSHTLTL